MSKLKQSKVSLQNIKKIISIPSGVQGHEFPDRISLKSYLITYNLSNRDPSLDSPSLDPSFQFSRSIKQSRIPRSSLRNIIFFGKNKITTIEQIVRALDSNSVVYLLIALVVRLIAIISRLIKLLRKFSSIKTFITTISINLNPFQIRREGKEKKKQNGCLSVSSSFVSLPLFRRFLFYRACGSRPWKLTRRPIYADLHFPPPPLPSCD